MVTEKFSHALKRAMAHHRTGRLAEAETIYREILAVEPEHADALHLLGLVAHQRGEHQAALELIERAIAQKPAQAEFHSNIAIVLQAQGKLEEALASYRRAVEINPDSAEAQVSLGAALHENGERDEAADAYRRALSLDPSHAGAHVNLGNTLSAQGNTDEAVACFRRALKIEPEHKLACYNLGINLTARGELDEAITVFRRGLAADPDHAEAHHALGCALRDHGKRTDALACFRQAVRLAPHVPLFQRNLANELAVLDDLGDPDTLRLELIDALSHAYVDHDRLAKTSLRLLTTDVGFRKLWRSARRGDDGALHSMLQDGTALTALNDELFLLLLEKVRLGHQDAERLLTEARRYFLQVAAEQGASAIATQVVQDFLSALAHQCFFNEYVFFQTTEETRLLDQLRHRVSVSLAAPHRGAASEIALLAGYVPLSTVPGSENLLDLIGTGGNARFERLIIRQVREPREEEAIRSSELSASTVTDRTSQIVRAQYEENPYPRWSSLEVEQPVPMASVLKGLFPHLSPRDFTSVRTPKILVAGCGTGKHALSTANRFLGCDFLAVDLSLTSLSYAKRKAGELGVTNVQFAHKDILELADIGVEFDLIESAGVLHHLRDPVQGWQVLADLLKPTGFMKIGLYSEHARQAVVAARSFIAQQGYEATNQGIRRCRWDILALPDGAAAKGVTRFGDFYTMSTCRDLIFHVQEHRFTLPQIADILEDLDLEFLGFEIRDVGVRQAYAEQFPQDPTATDLQSWDQYEQAHPATFSGMYQFWVQKRSRKTAGESAADDPSRPAIAETPAQTDFHSNRAIELQAQGKLEEALKSFRRAVENNRDDPEMHAKLAAALFEHRERDEAVESYRRALALDASNARAHNGLGIALTAQGKSDDALDCFRRALEVEPDHVPARRNLVTELGKLKFLDKPDRLKQELIACLLHPAVDHFKLANTSFRLLNIDPGFKQLFSLAMEGREDALEAAFRDGTALAALKDELFLLLLEKVTLSNLFVEKLLTQARRYFLRAALEQGASTIATRPAQEFLCALAQQCFITEYVYFQTPEETRWVDQLRENVAGGLGSSDRSADAAVALLACYRPLSAVPGSETLLDLIGTGIDDRFERLIIRQIQEPGEEAAIRRTELSASDITDDTSQVVRAQYEENPYPRWTSVDLKEPRPVATVLTRLFPHMSETDFPTVPSPRILVAGCGTGKHALFTAHRFLGCDLLAVDLSLTSLSYAKRKARELGVTNVQFAHKDILALSDIGIEFDLIESAGVLHHLLEPVRGWRVLADLLKPGGVMKIGLYSEHARGPVVAARALIAERGYEATDEGIRQCRRDIIAMPDQATKQWFAQSYDFFTMSSCRDLIFHVQEHRFTLPEIADILTDLDLEFLGFELDDPGVKQTYVEQFPQDPTAIDLHCWDQYEQAHPNTFAGMYHFWLQKRSRKT